MSLSSSDNEGAPLFLEHYEGSFTHEAMKINMINGRHIEMRNLFSFLDDTFLMSISHLKEKLLPIANPEPHSFWKAMDEKKVSLRDLIEGALQNFMKCTVLHQFGEDGILQRENTMIMQHITHLPYWDEWMRRISKGLHDHL